MLWIFIVVSGQNTALVLQRPWQIRLRQYQLGWAWSDKMLAMQIHVGWALVTPVLARTYCCKAVATAAPSSVNAQNLDWFCQTIWFLLLLWFFISWGKPLLFSSCSLPCIPECCFQLVQAVVLSAVQVWRLQHGGIGVGNPSHCSAWMGHGAFWCTVEHHVQEGFWELPFWEAHIIKVDLILVIWCFCLWDFGPEMKWFFAAVIVPRQHSYWQNYVLPYLLIAL